MDPISWSTAATIIGVVATIAGALLKIFSMKKENGSKELQKLRERLLVAEVSTADNKEEIDRLRTYIDKLNDLLIKLLTDKS